MCGIVGFTGHRQAAPVLLDGLEKLNRGPGRREGCGDRKGERSPARSCGKDE